MKFNILVLSIHKDGLGDSTAINHFNFMSELNICYNILVLFCPACLGSGSVWAHLICVQIHDHQKLQGSIFDGHSLDKKSIEGQFAADD